MARKELAARQRTQRTESSKKIRQAMKDGDERYYLPRDKGPVRRYIRDHVDARFSFLEVVIPVMVLTLVMGYSGVPTLVETGNFVLLGMFLLDHLRHHRAAVPAASRAHPSLPAGADEGHDAVRRLPGHADALHAAAQAPGQDRREAPRALPLTSRRRRPDVRAQAS